MSNLQKQLVQRRVETVRQRIFIVSFFVLMVIHCLENTTLVYNGYSWMEMLYALKELLYIVLLVKIVFLSNFSFQEMIMTGVSLFIAGVGYYCCDDFGLLELGIVLVSAKDIHIDQIAKLFVYVKSIAIPLTILGWKVGVIPTLYYKNGNNFYNTLGFCHRNVLGANIAILCIVCFFLRYKKIAWNDVVFWSVLAGVTYKLAYSRSSTVVILLTVVSVCLFKVYENALFSSKTIYRLITNIVIILFVISVVCTLFYDGESGFWKSVDACFTRRFSSSNYCLSKFGLSLWGQEIPFVSSLQAQKLGIDRLILDNAYARAIIYYGFIPGGLFLWVNYVAIKSAWLKKDGATVICMVIMAIYGLSERYMMDIYYQLPLIAAYQYCFSLKGKKQDLNEIN